MIHIYIFIGRCYCAWVDRILRGNLDSIVNGALRTNIRGRLRHWHCAIFLYRNYFHTRSHRFIVCDGGKLLRLFPDVLALFVDNGKFAWTLSPHVMFSRLHTTIPLIQYNYLFIYLLLLHCSHPLECVTRLLWCSIWHVIIVIQRPTTIHYSQILLYFDYT